MAERSGQSRDRRTLVIGDVHGHVDRLRALLEQEAIIDHDGRRFEHDVRVIQLGDLGHYGLTGDSDGDAECWHRAGDWLDLILWGNHDRALVDDRHRFAGFAAPWPGITEAINALEREGRICFAAHEHGHLLTHAGLHPRFEDRLPDRLDAAVSVLNAMSEDHVVNAISRSRGGRSPAGGILWRDHAEALSMRWPQVYGHSRGDEVRQVYDSWCVDVGGPSNGRLAAIWLPDLTVVEVALPAEVAA